MSLKSAEEKQAIVLHEKAEKLLARFAWFNVATKYEDAVEVLEQSASLYQRARKWRLAAECLRKGAECRRKLRNNTQAAITYERAGKMFLRAKGCEHLAIECVQEAITLFCSDGRFNVAGGWAERIAEIYASLGDMKNAITYFHHSAEYYDSANLPVPSMQCLESYGRAMAEQEMYSEAAKEFMTLSTKLLEHELLKFNSKSAVLYAIICLILAEKTRTAESLYKHTLNSDLSFKFSKEDTLIGELFKAIDTSDHDYFVDVVYSYDAVNALDPWELDMFSKMDGFVKEKQDLVEKLEEKRKAEIQAKLDEEKRTVALARRKRNLLAKKKLVKGKR